MTTKLRQTSCSALMRSVAPLSDQLLRSQISCSAVGSVASLSDQLFPLRSVVPFSNHQLLPSHISCSALKSDAPFSDESDQLPCSQMSCAFSLLHAHTLLNNETMKANGITEQNNELRHLNETEKSRFFSLLK